MERFFELVVFNYIYANKDAHLKNFSLVQVGKEYRLAPAYDLLNTSMHKMDDDFCLDGGLSPSLEKSDVMLRTKHPCRKDFERFGQMIGITEYRRDKILDKYMYLPKETKNMTELSFITDKKLKRKYLSIVNKRILRFRRSSNQNI